MERRLPRLLAAQLWSPRWSAVDAELHDPMHEACTGHDERNDR